MIFLPSITYACVPQSQGAVCNTGSCSNGNVCAQGHVYCLDDGSGYGDCSEEVNNCSTQCPGSSGPGDSGGDFSCGTYQGLPWHCTNATCSAGCITIRPTTNNCTIQIGICSSSSPGPCPTGQTGTVSCNSSNGNCETNCNPTAGPPPPPPPPPPTSTGIAPKAYWNGADCSTLWGWACDPDRYSDVLNIHFYYNNTGGACTSAANCTWLDSTTANVDRENAVGEACGGVTPAGGVNPNRNRGFSFATPPNLKDGTNHYIYAFAIGISSSGPDQQPNTQLDTGGATNKPINCTLPLPPCDICPTTGINACTTSAACGTTGTCNKTLLSTGGSCTPVNGVSCTLSKTCPAGQSCVSNSCVLPSCDTCGSGANACTASTPQCGNNLTGTCNKTTLAAGGSCTTVTNTSCTLNKGCIPGNYCNGAGSCVPFESWLYLKGDLHSNTNISLPGGH